MKAMVYICKPGKAIQAAVQEKLFNLGYHWFSGRYYIINTYDNKFVAYFCNEDGSITYLSDVSE